MQIAKRVWDFSTSQDLLRDGDQVVVGVSGGPDSLCLLEVLHSLAPRHGLRLYVAHLNHGLRPEAAVEERFVQAEAEQRDLGFFSETVDVATTASANKQSIETTARALRYDFFGRVARLTGARVVAVAHTADDQAETVLMHLLRGSGLRGLRGMLPKRVIGELVIDDWTHSTPPDSAQLPTTNYQLPLYLIRPLLSVTRAEIMTYCAENNLAPRMDSTNTDIHYFRNRVRHELLPMLETYNPNVRAVLTRTATAAAGDYELWQAAVHKLWTTTSVATASEPGRVVFDRGAWLALSVPEQRALLRLALEHLVGGLDEIGFTPLDAALQFSRGAEPGRSCELAGGLVLRVELRQIIISGLMVLPDIRDWPSVVDGGLAPGWHLSIEPLGKADWNPDQIAATPRWTAHVDARLLSLPLQVRARQLGDWLQPLGLAGHTMLLSDFLVNQKIPAQRRDNWPLLVSGDEIVWVVGLRLDERYKVTEDTQEVTRISVVPDAGD